VWHLTAAAAAVAVAGPDMSAPGMLAAINNARLKALPASPTAPAAAEWRLQETAVPLAVTAVRAAALTGDREAVVASLQQQLMPMKPTPINAPQVGCGTLTSSEVQLKVHCSALQVACSCICLSYRVPQMGCWLVSACAGCCAPEGCQQISSCLQDMLGRHYETDT
jgi:hypothetical protein